MRMPSARVQHECPMPCSCTVEPWQGTRLCAWPPAQARSAAASSRIPSVVVDAIKQLSSCLAARHRPQRQIKPGRGALSGLSGQRHGRWCRIRAPSSCRRSGPSDLCEPYLFTILTHMYHILVQRTPARVTQIGILKRIYPVNGQASQATTGHT